MILTKFFEKYFSNDVMWWEKKR